LSAQICSLSRPAEAATCAGTKYGRDQLAWLAIRWGVTLSMWETVIAKLEFWPPCSILVSVRLVARVEKYRREPLAHEKWPLTGAGPKVTPVSLRDRSPFS
jgi:hypothetical protein